MTTCERCGADLSEDARFCAQCGAPVAAETTEERKVVTMLFADLADSTHLASRLDPERFRELVGAFYTMCAAELVALNGRAEKFVGDAVMAVFGLPHAHDDDATRAIHAGARIRDRVATLGERWGVELRVRIGVNTGPVAAGSGPAGQFLVSGAPVNLAARLQQAAVPGEILAGATTQALTAGAVRYGDERKIDAKGFDEPMAAWPVESLTVRGSRRSLAMIGRRRELSLLHDTFERAGESSRVHMITLLGEAGIGKSRLIEQFIGDLPSGARVLIGRATEFDEDPTFSALGEMIRRELGVKRDAPREEVAKLLRELVDGCCEVEESERIAARLGLAVGLGDQQTEGNPYEVAEIRAGVLALMEGLARSGTVTLLFEDMEIARPGLLDLIEQLVTRAKRIPALIVCVARDGLLETRPTWSGGMADAITIRLESLPERDGSDLARAAGDGLSDADVDRIVGHSGGNPFFIVEIAGMLKAERQRHNHDIPHGALLPPTVQAVVASRIDHLPPAARDLVRKASVFPRSTFHVAELALVTRADEETLDALEDEDLLVRDDKRPGVWRFRHELLRDVAYETLPKRERMRLHLAVADGLPEKERYPSVIAMHLEEAARASLDLNPADRTLADRAVEALGHAGDVQRRRIQTRNALDLYERALTLAGPSERWGAREARILSGMGEAKYWRGEYDDAMSSLERAIQIASGDTWVRAHANRFIGDIALNVHGNLARAEWTFDEAIAAAYEHEDTWTIARTLLVASWAPYTRGDLHGSQQMLEDALAAARNESNRDRWAEARALTFLATVTAHEGCASDVLALAQESLQIGLDLDDAFTVAVARQTIAVALRRLGRLDEAFTFADDAVGAFTELGAPWERASALGDRGNIARLRGQLTESETDLREALSICRQLKERTLAAWTASELARLLTDRGELDEAQSLLRHPSTQVAATEVGSRISLANSAALVAMALDDSEEAGARFAESGAMERERGWRNHVAAHTWVVAQLCGPELVGGADVVSEARAILEAADWRLALNHPRSALP